MLQKVCIVALLVVGVLVLDYVRIVAELDVRAVEADVRVVEVVALDAEMVVVVLVNLIASQVVLVLVY